jgi:putative membrane protein
MVSEYYLTIKALHLIAVIAWVAGLLYLPRFYLHHLEFDVGTKGYEVFCKMERGLLKIIMLPSIIVTFLLGILLASITDSWSAPWFHMKLTLVFGLAAFHGYLARIAKGYALGKKPSLSRNTLRMISELPFLVVILIVFLAVLKPF